MLAVLHKMSANNLKAKFKHWKQDKEMFSGYAEFYKENNKIIMPLKQPLSVAISPNPPFCYIILHRKFVHRRANEK